jgi:integrase
LARGLVRPPGRCRSICVMRSYIRLRTSWPATTSSVPASSTRSAASEARGRNFSATRRRRGRQDDAAPSAPLALIARPRQIRPRAIPEDPAAPRFALLLYTAQRRGDVMRMGRQHIRDGVLTVKQQKTGITLAIPVHPEISPEPETFSPPPSETTVVDAPALAPVAEADRLRSSRCMRHARHPFHTTVAGVRPPERTLVPRLANTGPRISPDPCFWDQSRQSELKGNWRSIAMDPTPVSSR